MNYERIYEYRFRDVDQASRETVWNEIAGYLYARMGMPERVLDPAAGRCEFINAIPATERWIIDLAGHVEQFKDDGVKAIIGDVLDVDLPAAYFDGVFVSNFLEHLTSQEDVSRFLEKMHACLKPGGRIAVVGPNFKYCAQEYFDCAHHTLALTHVSVEEHLYGAGFEIQSVVPRFLPYSFRGVLPPSSALTRLYLRLPVAWRIMGKQFLFVARRGSPASLSDAG